MVFTEGCWWYIIMLHISGTRCLKVVTPLACALGGYLKIVSLKQLYRYYVNRNNVGAGTNARVEFV